MWLKLPRCWRRPAAARWKRFRVKPPRISSACSLKCHLQKRWHDADPDNSRLRILGRCSLLGEGTGDRGVARIVIDTSPDLREQLIDADVDHIDAVFLTHEHADQTHGIDDLRSVVLHQRKRIPVYLNQSTADQVLLRFSYCFVSPPESDYPPILDSHLLHSGENRTIEGKGGPVTLSAFLLQHGNIP